jgi:surfeit locus 1 family protein
MSSLTSIIAERFRFTLWPTLFTIPAVILMLGLGTWQVQRLAWKTALIDAREAAIHAAPVPLPATLDQARPLDFHRVIARGIFLHDKELYVGAFSPRGNEGFQIVTPLRLADGTLLLVNRGWVPEKRKDPATRADAQIAGPVEIEGVMRIPVTPTGFIVPKNRPAENFWFWVDPPAMAEARGLAGVLPFFIEAGNAPNPGGYPMGGQTRISLPNDHLQYAITWYILAVALVVIYLVYHYRPPTTEAAPQ